ncbi:MAG TPA: VOC family protein [Gemmatimonadaceae bacterium]|jgi:catechol 2,3-dioxygenase-like lactoylglutathione lyase family enzyme
MLKEVEGLIAQYDRGGLTRRQLLHGLLALGVGGAFDPPTPRLSQGSSLAEPVFKTRTINHVTLYSADVPRSKAFYEALTGLPVRDEGEDFFELRLEGSFLGIYAAETGTRPGIDHFCFGVDQYEPSAALAALKSAAPTGQPTLENGNQVYVRDPDGVRVQFADVSYKR